MIDPHRLRVATFRTTVGLAVALVTSACAVGGSSAPPIVSVVAETEEHFWDSFRFEGDEAEGFVTLRAMASGADAIVVGQLVDFGVSRSLQGDAREDVLFYGVATLTVTEVVSGDLDSEEIPLEFILSASSQDEAEEQVKELTPSLPARELVVFLREKRGEDEAGLYRPVNSLGLWAATSRSELDTPLSPEQGASVIYQEELTGIADLGDLVDLIKAG